MLSLIVQNCISTIYVLLLSYEFLAFIPGSHKGENMPNTKHTYCASLQLTNTAYLIIYIYIYNIYIYIYIYIYKMKYFVIVRYIYIYIYIYTYIYIYIIL